jgi:hypothetical protein
MYRLPLILLLQHPHRLQVQHPGALCPPMQLCKPVKASKSITTFYVISANKSQIRSAVTQQVQFSIPASPMQLTRHSTTVSAKQTLPSKLDPILLLSSSIILTRLRWNTTVTNCTTCIAHAMGSHTNAGSAAQPVNLLINIQAAQKILCNITGQVLPSEINGAITRTVGIGLTLTTTFESPIEFWNMTLLSAPLKRREDTGRSLSKYPLGALALGI